MINRKTKVVGVLGGYGPFATNDFFRLLLENNPVEKDWDHLHIIIDNNPRIPSRARAFLFDEESPVPYMYEAIKRLKNAGADFFVCPCNTAHYFLKEMDLELPFLNMIDMTVAKISEQGYEKIAIIGSEVTTMTKLYENALLNLSLKVFNVEDLTTVRFIIEAGKQNKNLIEAKDKMNSIIDKFKKEGADCVIYACTELPIILPISECKLPVFDSSSILAKETVDFAKK